MRLEPGDQQIALVDAVRTVLDDLVTTESHRNRRDGGPLNRSTWSTLGELGLFGIAVPEAEGGLGLGVVELCLVLEEVGRSGLAAPVLETSVVVAPLLATLVDDRRDLLEDVLAGQVVTTSTLVHDGRLAGDALEADVIARVGAQVHLDLATRFVCRAQHSMDDTRRVSTVEPDGARVVPLAKEALEDLTARIVVANSALVLGIASKLFEQTVRYVGERRQFSRPIGSFQAVKHRLADVHIELEASRSAIWAAATELDESPGRSAHVAAHVAAAIAGEAAEIANDSALQLHGGIGYTWEHDLQIWLKQGLVVGRRLGRPALHRRRAIEFAGLFDPNQTAVANDPTHLEAVEVMS